MSSLSCFYVAMLFSRVFSGKFQVACLAFFLKTNTFSVTFFVVALSTQSSFSEFLDILRYKSVNKLASAEYGERNVFYTNNSYKYLKAPHKLANVLLFYLSHGLTSHFIESLCFREVMMDSLEKCLCLTAMKLYFRS